MWPRLLRAKALIEGLEVMLESGRATPNAWDKLEQAEVGF